MPNSYFLLACNSEIQIPETQFPFPNSRCDSNFIKEKDSIVWVTVLRYMTLDKYVKF